MTGNFYCVDAACARVVYQEYLPPVVRWQYPNEDWQEIQADSYTVVPQTGQCFGQYQARGSFTSQIDVADSAELTCGRQAEWFTEIDDPISGKIIDYEILEDRDNYVQRIKFYSEDEFGVIRTKILIPYTITFDWFIYKLQGEERYTTHQVAVQNECVNRQIRSNRGNNFVVSRYIRLDAAEDECGTCTFTIFNGQEIIHQETRDVCPEVEQLDCRLSDEFKQIEIEKTPYLQRIEVVDYAYDVRVSGVIDSNNYGFLLSKEKIPDECLNIYNNSITSTIPNDFFQIANTPENGYNQIAQICSASECPPPEYEVICDCDCEECPPDSCAIECQGVICCYDETGKAIKQIPTENYCQT